MYFDINVSRFGSHIFATAERSLTNESEAQACYALFMVKFPESEGYQITVSKKETIGHSVDWAPHIAPYKTALQHTQDRKVCFVMERVGCTPDVARAALESEEWDTSEAIFYLRHDK